VILRTNGHNGGVDRFEEPGGFLHDALPCRAARPVAQFDERIVAELVVVAADRPEVRDLARVQYLEGTGRASTSWFVATPDTVGDLSLVLKVKVQTPVTCSFALRLPVGTPLTWRVYRSALRRATDLVLRVEPETGWGLISLPAPNGFSLVVDEVERQLLVN
jgi:hypothetical protein